MSTDSLPKESSENGQHATLEVPGFTAEADVEDTPRSEVPPSFSVMTPNAAEAAAKHSTSASGGDYFTPQPASQSTAPAHDLQPRSHPATISSTVSASDALAAGHVVLPDAVSSLHPRPPPHTTASSISIESSASSATITPETAALWSGRNDFPRFPNQALSALHSQYYPPPYVPPAFRHRGSQPHQISTFASAIASLHSSGVRTAHNSPAVTPSGGLFSPAGPPSAPLTEGSEGSGAGTYASPFLHFTHTHVPKETHVADVDVDPVSGRKLINHYEIIDELGRGTHGKVKLGRDLTSPNHQPTFVAIKIVERFSKRRKLGRLGTTEDKVKKEVAILKKARHPNVVALLEVIDDPSRKKVYIVLEWVERGEINWRVKGPKEIGMIEARRYEREKSGDVSDRALAQDAAVLTEAQKRLSRQKRRQMKAYRLMKRGTTDMPEAWSIELAGDTGSEESEEDRLSRISSHTAQSDAGRLSVDPLNRRPFRAPSPLHPSLDPDNSDHFTSLTSEPEAMSPEEEYEASQRRPSSALSMTGLEGTMYGAYDQSQTSRVASSSSLTSSRGHSEGLNRVATEILDSHLDTELEYVPIMTMDQIRVAFRDTLLGLQYLHYQGIVHRDIKPPNLLATIDNRVKISDFGVSYLGRPVQEGEQGEDVSETEAQDLDDEAKELAKTVGTPAFYAPELCNTEPSEEPLPVTKAIDVWALGVTLFCMLFARTPFVDNEFVVMRQICDEDIYLPRRRLQPVDTNPKSRSTSHGRAFPPLTSGKRHELDLVYEEINDELHDLLRRLLIKDPRKRITLEEVRHHPWVLSDLPNKLKWLEETDPQRLAEGKKIEVSKEDMNTAVVPLNLVERMRSGLKKMIEKTGITRARGTSNAGSGGVSAGSSSSTISQDARRQSLRTDDPIAMALKASRETSQSHPSPDLDLRERYSDAHTGQLGEQLSRVPSRPGIPQRAMTVASAAGSMRTVTQSDFQNTLAPPSEESSPPPSPGLPGTPRELASPGGSHLGGLLGGTSRFIKTVRDRSAHGRRKPRGGSSDRASVSVADSTDPHGEASLAVSQTTASGHVHPPDSLRELTPDTSSHNSPSSSRAQSVAAGQHLHPQPAEPGLLSRMSSSSSLASLTRHVGSAFSRSSSRAQQRHAPESSAEEWKRADEERVRKLVREEQDKGRASPQRYCMSPTEFDGREARDCPESPDDMHPSREDSRVPSISNFDTPPDSVSPTNQTGQLPSALVSSTSDLGSAVSMSISNPSIPSVISEASSVDPNEGLYVLHDDKRELSSDDTLNPHPEVRTYEEEEQVDEGYSPDQETALESGQDDDGFDSSSDSDGGLQMRRKSNARVSGHGLSLAAATPKERRGTGLSIRSKKSSRSGSSNTMKKVKTRESAEGRRSLEISEE